MAKGKPKSNGKKQEGKRPGKPDKWHLILVKEIHARPLALLARDLPRKAAERLVEAIGEDLKAELRAVLFSRMAGSPDVSYEKCYISNGMWCCQTCMRDPLGNEVCSPPRCRPLSKDIECIEPLDWDTAEHEHRA